MLPYDDGYYANGSLAEPMSCIIGAFRSSYHTEPLVWEHQMGLRPGGRLALLGSGGAMGIGALDYALNGPFTPSLVVAVDVDAERLDRLRRLFPAEEAERRGCRLEVVDASGQDTVEAAARHLPGRLRRRRRVRRDHAARRGRVTPSSPTTAASTSSPVRPTGRSPPR